MSFKKPAAIALGIVLSLSVVPSLCQPSSLQWRKVNSGTPNSFYAVSAPDTLNIWALTGTKVFRSTDGGKTWDSLAVGGGSDVVFVDRFHGWVLGGEGFSVRITKTTDGGITWRDVEKNRFFLFGTTSISFPDNLHGWAGGDEDPLLFTKDGGETWDTMSIILPGSPRFSVHKVFFMDSLNGWAGGLDFPLGDTAILVRTTDGGKNWQLRNLPRRFGSPLYSILDIDFLDSLNGYLLAVTGTTPSFLRTTDGGTSWDTMAVIFEDLDQADFINPAMGWAAGFTVVQGQLVSLISTTEDSSKNFSNTPIVSGYPLQDIDMLDSTHGWAVGHNGTILVYSDVTTDVPEPKGQRPTQFELGQNYPNPFNQGTQIPFSFSGNRAFQVTLSIYNLLGQPVRKLLDKKLLPGSHSVFWDGEDEKGRALPSGIYFYKLTVGEQQSVKKMLLIK